MSETTDDIVNGEICDICLYPFEYPNEHPATCNECWADLTKGDRKKHTKSDYNRCEAPK